MQRPFTYIKSDCLPLNHVVNDIDSDSELSLLFNGSLSECEAFIVNNSLLLWKDGGDMQIFSVIIWDQMQNEIDPETKYYNGYATNMER